MSFAANCFWIRQPQHFIVTEEKIKIFTKPFTDLWQRTYYGFQNDNASVLQMYTEEQFFLYRKNCF